LEKLGEIVTTTSESDLQPSPSPLPKLKNQLPKNDQVLLIKIPVQNAYPQIQGHSNYFNDFSNIPHFQQHSPQQFSFYYPSNQLYHPQLQSFGPSTYYQTVPNYSNYGGGYFHPQMGRF